MAKGELDFFYIDGKYYGGSQEWAGGMMRLGGCSAVTCCEVCIYLAGKDERLRGLYPYDPHHVTMQDFMRFFRQMFKYVYPGWGGLTMLTKFIKMFGDYIRTTGVPMTFKKLDGHQTFTQARNFIKQAVDAGLPVMYLLLKHYNKAFDLYEWHWFTVTGYEETDDTFFVDFATWGTKHRFDLQKAWDTRMEKKGGLVYVMPVHS